LPCGFAAWIFIVFGPYATGNLNLSNHNSMLSARMSRVNETGLISVAVDYFGFTIIREATLEPKGR